MVKFGTAGLDANFTQQGFKKTIEAPIYLEKMGLDAFVQPVSPLRANVIGQAGEGEKALLLNGHLDVVPAVGNWSSDPFVMTERDGKFYGRGTADMKGPIAAMMAAMKWHMD